MVSYLITSSGDIRIGNADPFLADNVAFDAVTVHGEIEWLERTGHIRIRMRPSLTTPAAQSRLLDWLNSTRPPRVLLSYFVRQRWHYEFSQEARKTPRRVERLKEIHGGGPIRHQARPLDDPRNTAGVLATLDFWRARRSNFNPTADLGLLEPLLGSRWLLLEGPEYRVSQFGQGNSPYVMKWLETNVGAPLTSGPDAAYARSCVTVYRTAVEARQPLMEDVDTLANWGSYGRVRSRYCRLMLPLEGGRKNWLLVSTAIDAGIDLIE